MSKELIIVLLLSCIHLSQPFCFRERKSWNEMNPGEKKHYLKAVQLAMDGGYHAMFTEIYSEEKSRQEAHLTSGYLYWHRKFLLAYENMLRSQGKQFKCLTIPYWDFYEDYAKWENGECKSNLENCSPILKDFGGSSGIVDNITLKGEVLKGNCATGYPMNHFCESSNKSGKKCKKCLPRGNWANASLPSGMGIASLVRIISFSTGFSQLSQHIQRDFDHTLKEAVGSILDSYSSPADPLFFSIHAFIDMLQHTFFECRVGRAMGDQEKKTSKFAYEEYSYDSSIVKSPTSTSTITHIWELPSVPTVLAHKHPKLAQFYEHTPGRYFEFVDTYDLLYWYKIDSFATLLVTNGLLCQQIPPQRRLSLPLEGNQEVSRSSRYYRNIVHKRRRRLRNLSKVGRKLADNSELKIIQRVATKNRRNLHKLLQGSLGKWKKVVKNSVQRTADRYENFLAQISNLVSRRSYRNWKFAKKINRQIEAISCKYWVEKFGKIKPFRRSIWGYYKRNLRAASQQRRYRRFRYRTRRRYRRKYRLYRRRRRSRRRRPSLSQKRCIDLQDEKILLRNWRDNYG